MGSHNIEPTYPVWPPSVLDTGLTPVGSRVDQRDTIESLKAKLAATEQQLAAQTAALRASEALRTGQMEDELERTKRLAAIGHLAAGVAHEINNPLTVMQLRIDLLREQHTDPELRGQLRVVREHIQRVARIVSKLQTFARPAPMEPEAIALQHLLATAIERSAQELEGIDVDLQLPDDVAVVGSKGALEQVFVNVLSNAAQASERPGPIVVRAEANAQRVVVSVLDHGPGIPVDLLNDLFTPFTSGKPQRGTGLGLAIAWSLVHDLGGTLSGANHPSGGAEFTITLPAASAFLALAATPDPPERAPEFRGDLLLLDDDHSVATVLADVASSFGYRVVTARDAKEALALIHQRPFEGLLADVHLPGMSGTELLEQLRATHPKLARRTVLMSGLFLDLDPSIHYLQKPFSRHRLDQTLRELS